MQENFVKNYVDSSDIFWCIRDIHWFRFKIKMKKQNSKG